MLLVAISVFAATSWIAGGFFGVDASCNENAFACNALTEVLATLLAVAVAVASFLYWRVFRVARLHTAIGLDDPAKLVPTATRMGEVVGREAICEIIEEDLRSRKRRRPQIIVGDVGEGKTAVLVKLTELLIDRGAVPVAIDLREAEVPLHFQDLAHKRFHDNIQHGVLSEDEGEKAWRKLCKDERIVVLADGLEEALDGQAGRHTEIRKAVKKARDDKLPLVIAARPDEVLRGLDAALIRLEPLSASDAVKYMKASEDMAAEVEQLAAAAAMTEAPLYLWLADKLPAGQRHVPIDKGRSGARVALLNRWRDGLVELNLNKSDFLEDERKAGLESLELMAYVSLCERSDAVRFKALGGVLSPETPSSAERNPRIAARVGEDLELVERIGDGADGDGVRFRHSVLQGYLGGRAVPTCARLHRGGQIGAAIRHPRRTLTSRGSQPNLDKALANPTRELLMALTVASFSASGPDLPRRLAKKLERAVLHARSADAFELLATAYEISHCTGESDELGRIARELWERSSHEDAAQMPASKVTEAKLRAVDRMDEAGGPAALRALWTVCMEEQNYAVRLRAAQAVADGGEQAYEVLRSEIDGVGPADLSSDAAGERPVRRCSMHGWILPTLATSCRESPPAVDHITAKLGEWVEQSGEGVHLGVEGCFAQGLKYAANRLPHRTLDSTTATLARHTQKLLSASNWWYSQLTLLQALTLWGLNDRVVNRGEVYKTLADWKRGRRHPLVREMARLCEKTMLDAHELGTGATGVEPSRYLWIDEAGVAGKIGALSAPPSAKSTAGLWIPRSAGWTTLDPQARTLVAETLLLLNLIEGGEAPPERPEDRARWARIRPQQRERLRQTVMSRGPKLPPCLVESGKRKRLDVEAEHGAQRNDDGSTDCCPFGLCPYPAPEENPFRGELRETFCRGQERLLKQRGVPPWHKARWHGLRPRQLAVRELAEFWRQMEARAQKLSVKTSEPENGRNGAPDRAWWRSRLETFLLSARRMPGSANGGPPGRRP